MLDDATEAVAMGSDDNVLSRLNFRGDDIIPERQGAGDGVFQWLTGGELTRFQILVTPGLEVTRTVEDSLLPQ